MTVSRLVKVGLAALLSLAFLAGCGGDDDDDTNDDTTTEDTTDESTEDTTEESTEDTTDDTPEESTEPAEDGTGEDVTEPVTTAYDAFFADFDVTYLEEGDTFPADVVTTLKDNLANAGGATVTIKTVTALGDADCSAKGVAAPCAEVNYDLGVGDNPVALPDQTGFAVEVDGTWKVAKTTFCTLASLGGSTPEVC